MNTMKTSHKGQTLVETVLVLMLLFILFFGIAEIARAWYLKNALENAARVGARVAIVTSGISNETRTIPSTIPPASSCTALTGNDKVFCNIWTSSGLPTDTTSATLTITAASATPPPVSGDSVTVNVGATFVSVMPGLTNSNPGGFGWTSIFSFLASRPMSAQSTMRYE
jgi:Flp pilus assembly protein TadG